jgi:excisionase family DNA binding protein
MRNEPVVTTGHTPARIPLPLKEDENPATASMKEPETAPSVGTTPDRVEADSEAPAEALRVADSNPEMAEEGVVAAEALEEAVSPSNGQDGKAARKRAPRVTTKKAAVQSAAQETPEEAQALWDRVPRHVQALIRTQDNEVAQNSYKKSFRESRSDLIRRLLDPELSLEEAARILGVCPTTVRRYTNRGLLSHHRTGGNQRRFRLSHVLEFMERFGVSLSDTEAEARDETDAPWEKSSPRLEEDLLGSASGSPS